MEGLWFPAGLSPAAEQQRSAVHAEACGPAHGQARQAPLVYRPHPGLLPLVGRREVLFRPARLLSRPVQRRQLRSVLDADTDRTDLELRLTARPSPANIVRLPVEGFAAGAGKAISSRG